GAVFLASDAHERDLLTLVLYRGVEDSLHLTDRVQNPVCWQLQGPIAFVIGHELVPKPDVAEGAAHHHLVIATPRAVRVELTNRRPVLDQIPPRGRILGN